MNLLIAGDLVPTKSNEEMFNNGDVKGLLGNELFSIWSSVDMRIINLEVPIVDNENPIDKCGPNLITPKSTIKGIKLLKPSLLTVANNHILDQGVKGFNETINILKSSGIPFVGGGRNIYEASKPYILEKDGLKIGIYACAEHEFTIATKSSCGANLFDPLESLDHIQDLKSKSDYVIVLYHGGKEHYRYPSPYLQKVCRKIVEKGADLVVCQHSHCIGSFEVYKDSTIVYGQGNFIFDDSDSEFWKTSILIKLTLEDKAVIEYIPIVKEGNSVRLAKDKIARQILLEFNERSKKTLNEEFIEKEYSKFAEKSKIEYLRCFSGQGKWLSRFDRILLKNKLIKKKYNKENILAIQNFIECEAHRELILESLKEL